MRSSCLIMQCLLQILILSAVVRGQKWFTVTNDFFSLPNNNGSRVKVQQQIELNEIFVDAIGMIVEMGYFMHLRWQDDRFINNNLNHTLYPKDPIAIFGQDADFQLIWIPDIYMINEVPSGIYNNEPTDVIYVYQNGTLTFSKRFMTQFYCKVRVFKIPMSHETCSIQFHSNAYTVTQMDLTWFEGTEVTFSDDFVSLVSEISDTTASVCRAHDKPCLQLDLHIDQQYMGFLIQVYLPSSAIIIMQWLGFWIHIKEVSGRIRIVSVAFLATVTQMTAVMIVFPDTVQLEPLLIWNGFCVLMNLLAFVEYILVHNMYINGELKKKQNQELIVPEPKKTNSGVNRIKVQPIDVDVDIESGANRSRKRKRSSTNWCCDCMTAHRLDRVCMVAFIQIYIIFVIVYWTSFMTISD